jgi:hypothetical protein
MWKLKSQPYPKLMLRRIQRFKGSFEEVER